MANIIKIISMTGTREVNLDSFNKDVVSFGRTHECDIQLGEEYISRLHGCFYKENGAWCFKDMDSTNGIYFQGVKTDSAPLRNDDEIVIHKKNSLSDAVKMVYIQNNSQPIVEDSRLNQMDQLTQMNQMQLQQQQMQQMNQLNQMQLQQQIEQQGQLEQERQQLMQSQMIHQAMPPQLQPEQMSQPRQQGPQIPVMNRRPEQPVAKKRPAPLVNPRGYDDEDEEEDEIDDFKSDKIFLVVGIIIVMLLLIVGLILFLKIFNEDDKKGSTTEKKTIETTVDTTGVKDDAQTVDSSKEPGTGDTTDNSNQNTENSSDQENTGADQIVDDLGVQDGLSD